MNAPAHFDAPDRLLRLPEVSEMVGLSKSMIYRKMRDGSFPAAIKPGGVSTRWKESEVCRWVEKVSENRIVGSHHG
ncbi:helix-turn-helix transcriptional regulator [Sphingomonas sp. 3-13AW]|jgi:prophage regulatory protein|uniref:helix-turn-helix transcriptional regulator n=1 Tax=Sphingomonas sp. 3-13AW TaxID=3050450 RepID=UPI003BB70A4C